MNGQDGSLTPDQTLELLLTLEHQSEPTCPDSSTPLDPERVKAQRWQCCMTDELLTLIQAGREDEALEILMNRLLGKVSDGKCSNVAECVSGGCPIRNADAQDVTPQQDRMAQTTGD